MKLNVMPTNQTTVSRNKHLLRPKTLFKIKLMGLKYKFKHGCFLLS